MTPLAATPDADADVRRRRLLDAALATFMRFGYRKTSMEEVARAAGLSRQGLYGHFATKEELFRAVVHHVLATGLDAATDALRDAAAPVEQRLTGAFDAWVGRFVGLGTGDLADLHEALDELVGPEMADHEERFADAVTRTVRGAGLAGAYRAAGLTARQLADTLHATARGLKHGCATRAEFVERIGVAVRAMCAPLHTR